MPEDLKSYEFVSPMIDSAIQDLDSLEITRRSEVNDVIAYLDSITTPLSLQVRNAVYIMEGRITDPYATLRIPENISVVSLSDLQELVSKIANAYATYGEYMSAIKALVVVRENLYERRKNRAMINEGTNEQTRKGLSSMRSEPEFLLMTKVQVISKWVETRYFMFSKMLDVVSSMLTTKSVQQTRSDKEID